MTATLNGAMTAAITAAITGAVKLPARPAR